MLIRLYRSLHDWGQADLAERAELDPASIFRYEAGRTVPQRETRERLAEEAGLPMPFVETVLLPVLEAALAGSASFTEETFADLEKSAAELDRALAGTGRAAIRELFEMLEAEEREPWERTGPPAEADRLEAADAWERLKGGTAEGRRFLVKTCREFQTWGLAERLCRESADVPPEEAEAALELAKLACQVAELAPGEEGWRSRLQGYAWAHLGSARRACGDSAGGAEAAARARKLWEASADNHPGLLDETVILGLLAELGG